jgi:hypothetical protein
MDIIIRPLRAIVDVRELPVRPSSGNGDVHASTSIDGKTKENSKQSNRKKRERRNALPT